MVHWALLCPTLEGQAESEGERDRKTQREREGEKERERPPGLLYVKLFDKRPQQTVAAIEMHEGRDMIQTLDSSSRKFRLKCV